jgi:hypothetical protein
LQSFFRQYGWLLYGVLNISLGCALVVGAAVNGGSVSELPYVMMLFAICSSPLPFITRPNGVMAMLGVAMAVYFVGFGLGDAAAMFAPPKSSRPDGVVLDAGEIVLLLGALVQLIGFHLGARIAKRDSGGNAIKDWPRSLFLPLGLVFWLSGLAATLYQSLVLQSDNSNAAVVAGFTKLGIWNTSGLILIVNYAGPLGIVILSYWWTKYSHRWGTAVVLAVIVVQFAAGWVVDQKETALSAPLVMMLTRFIIGGRVPMRWLLCSMLGIVLVFPVLTAKRIIMNEGLGLTRAQALAHTGEILMRAIAERQVARQGKYEEKTQTFLERVNDKAAVELFAAHLGIDQTYKMGSTLTPILYVFAPRVLWSDKPSENSAQTFNREFHISADRDTHISPTHIGELYWNFGFVGVAMGMLLIGILLGVVCGRFDPSLHSSITGVLVLIVTFYELVARRGGQIEIEYAVWIRTLLLIGLLHLVFARQRGIRMPGGSPAPREPTGSLSLRFPNLLR